MSWNDGYVADVHYPAFFYKEMQPAWLAVLAEFQGFAAPDVGAPFSLCELGCGAGINLLVAAACHPGARFVGVDANADALQVGRDAAARCGLENLTFLRADFSRFASHAGDKANGYAGAFDFITCHGTWSWIAAEQRHALLTAVVHSLKRGGLFYLHYMTHPGSTDLAPIQHLLNLCAHHMPGSSPHKVQVGLQLLRQLVRGGVFAQQPSMLRHLENLAKRSAEDLAHEFLADHWQPQHCADVHQQVGRAGLPLIGSADVFNAMDAALSVPEGLQALIRQTAVPALAETLKDMARNAHQRMDLFQADPVRLDDGGRRAVWERRQVRLLRGAPGQGPIAFDTPIGTVTGEAAIFTPLLRRLAQGAASLGELSQLPVFAGDMGGVVRAVQLLMMQQMVHVVTPQLAAEERVRRLSHWFEREGIRLTVVPECGTALPQAEGL